MYELQITRTNFLLVNFLIILLYSVIYYTYGNPNHILIKHDNKDKDKDKLTYIDSLYFSVLTYSTLGSSQYLPHSNFMKLINMSQIIILIIMFIVFVHIKF